MKKLCFGTFAKVLVLCKANSVKQKRLCGTILLSIAPEYDIREDDGTTSDLVLGKKNLSSYVTDPAPLADGRTTADYFSKKVLPLLDDNKYGIAVLALKDIIASDDSIELSTQIEKINNLTKKTIVDRDAFVFADLLAGLFLYTAISVENNHCEDSVKEITEDYLQSFEPQKTSIAFITSYANLSAELVEELEIDSHALVLVTETGGGCQRCGRPLGVTVDGEDTSYAKVLWISEKENIVLCVKCEREVQNAPDEDKALLLTERQALANRISARDAVSRHTLEKQIEEVLREISQIDVSDETKLKTDPIKVERKITDKRLKERVLLDVTQLYDAVNNALDRLSGEDRMDVDKFAKNIKRMFEDASETLTSQSEIYNLLAETLFDNCGRKYKQACEIIISYFVQRCEVFNEIAE